MYGSALNHFDNQRPCDEEATQIANQMRYQIEAAMNQNSSSGNQHFFAQDIEKVLTIELKSK